MKLASILAAALVAAVLTAAALGAAGSKQGGLPVIDVTMDGSSIAVTGDLLSGAVNIHMVATDPASGTPILVRLNDGVTANDFIAFINSPAGADPNSVGEYGSIVFDAEAGPGTNDIQTILKSGDYIAFDGSKNDPTQWPNTTFSISENKAPSTLPAADQWQKSVEFRFRGPTTLHTGQVIRVSNAGFLVHMIVGFGVKSQAAGHVVARLLRAGAPDKAFRNLASNQFFSFLGPVSHGAVQQFVLNVKPGWYVEACFMDTQDGREHTRLGMERLIHVVS